MCCAPQLSSLRSLDAGQLVPSPSLLWRTSALINKATTKSTTRANFCPLAASAQMGRHTNAGHSLSRSLRKHQTTTNIAEGAGGIGGPAAINQTLHGQRGHEGAHGSCQPNRSRTHAKRIGKTRTRFTDFCCAEFLFSCARFR